MDYRTAALTFAGVMIGFKLWSVFLIYLVSDDDGITTFILGTHFLWIAVPLLLAWGPLMFWYRLVRIRRRRNRLLEAEWNADPERPTRH